MSPFVTLAGKRALQRDQVAHVSLEAALVRAARRRS